RRLIRLVLFVDIRNKPFIAGKFLGELGGRKFWHGEGLFRKFFVVVRTRGEARNAGHDETRRLRPMTVSRYLTLGECRLTQGFRQRQLQPSWLYRAVNGYKILSIALRLAARKKD